MDVRPEKSQNGGQEEQLGQWADHRPDGQTTLSSRQDLSGCGWHRTGKNGAVEKKPIPSSGLTWAEYDDDDM